MFKNDTTDFSFRPEHQIRKKNKKKKKGGKQNKTGKSKDVILFPADSREAILKEEQTIVEQQKAANENKSKAHKKHHPGTMSKTYTKVLVRVNNI